MEMPDTQKLRDLEKGLREMQRRKTENRLQYYEPYDKQLAFHALGAEKRERLFMAGNQLGKTWAGGMEMAMHLTGDYPEWWRGRRFGGPVRTWVAGVTGESTRDNPQRILLGPNKPYGSGTIPKELLIDTRSGKGLPDAVDTIYVRHKSGSTSTVGFKSYEKGREKWQGETLDIIWFDEEPASEIYSEGLARITARSGLTFLTLTPLMGLSDVVRRFFSDSSPDRAYVQMAIDEAGHISEEARRQIIDGYPEHEREARTKGVPMLGSGRIYPIAESVITEEAILIPDHWPRICGIDFGWDHPTATVWLAWDRDSDTVHLYDCYRARATTPAVHAAAIKARGEEIPVAWPHDGLQHDKGSGSPLSHIYKQHGVKMLPERATFPDGGSSVEAGVLDILDRMQTFRFKVAAHLGDWFDEFRVYHRKNGRIVTAHNDLLDATRYAVMMLRSARIARPRSRGRRPQIAKDVDFEVFS